MSVSVLDKEVPLILAALDCLIEEAWRFGNEPSYLSDAQNLRKRFKVANDWYMNRGNKIE